MPKSRYGHCFHGVDYSVPPYELGPTMLADASNVVPNSSGLPTARNGSVKYNNVSLASRITSFFEHKTGSTKTQLVSFSTKVGSYNSGTGEFVDRITGLTSDKMMQWVNFAGKAIGVNEGSDAPQYFTDTSTHGALAGSPPSGNSITEWADRVWLGGDSSDVALLTGCALRDPTDWSDATADIGFIEQQVGDTKDPIIGIFPYFDWLLVGKRNNIYKAYSTTGVPQNTSTLAITPLYSKADDNVGFTSPWAITQIGNDIIFLDGFDIKSMRSIEEYGDVAYTSIIAHIRDFIEDTVDKDYLYYTQFFHYKKRQQIWISMPTGASTHYVFVLDYKFKEQTGRYSFYPMSGMVANCFGGVEDGALTNIYYGDETGFVRQIDVGANDDGAAITSYSVSMHHGNNPSDGVLDRHEYRKQWQYLDTYIKPTEAALSMVPYYATDIMDDAQIRTAGNYAALSTETVSGWTGTGLKQKRIRLYGVSSKAIALKWYHSTVAQNYIINSSMVDYQWKAKTAI
ncbi:MAG: hypothetical protein GY774_35740 [Planctomycetes bacterium]|nr:hypothetical protein [Planctomycetota bacterium]